MIQNQWYGIYPSSQLKPETAVGLKRLNQKIVLFRSKDGTLGCLRDRCSHRGAALHLGKVVGNSVACPFHGLQFDQDGTCKQIPALGKSSTADFSRFQIPSYHVREQYGIIYLWYGDQEPTQTLPFFYDEIGPNDVFSELEDHWDAFYSRCIENQLDVIHLPFVHHNTIGRGNKTLVNGPAVFFENSFLKTSPDNEVDNGQTPRPSSQCELRSVYLKFAFPNLWMNHVSDQIRIMIYFAPVDDNNTILYVRFYSKLARNKTINQLISKVGSVGNLIVERQDKRVVITQEPKYSAYRSNEKLLPGDRPIVEYRRIRESLKEGKNPQ